MPPSLDDPASRAFLSASALGRLSARHRLSPSLLRRQVPCPVRSGRARGGWHHDDGQDGPRTKLSITRRTAAALGKGSRLGPEHAALVRLAETTATALDEVVAGDEKRYVVAQLARAHLLTVEALLSVYDEDHLDPFATFVAGMSTPSVRTDPDLRARANPHSLRGCTTVPARQYFDARGESSEPA